jgi:hypothetical protein
VSEISYSGKSGGKNSSPDFKRLSCKLVKLFTNSWAVQQQQMGAEPNELAQCIACKIVISDHSKVTPERNHILHIASRSNKQ